MIHYPYKDFTMHLPHTWRWSGQLLFECMWLRHKALAKFVRELHELFDLQQNHLLHTFVFCWLVDCCVFRWRRVCSGNKQFHLYFSFHLDFDLSHKILVFQDKLYWDGQLEEPSVVTFDVSYLLFILSKFNAKNIKIKNSTNKIPAVQSIIHITEHESLCQCLDLICT